MIELIFFVVSFAVVFLLECLSPKRKTTDSIAVRWAVNVSLFVSNNAIFIVFIPYTMATFAVTGSPWWAIILTIVVLDLCQYGHHVVMHKYLWFLHRIHHTDKDIDVSTMFRTHPIANILNVAIPIGLVFVLGLSLEGILIYSLIKIIFNSTGHANIRISYQIEKMLSKYIVTPRVHEIHHSSNQHQTDTNYGSVICLWDKLFGTFTPIQNEEIDELGLTEHRESQLDRIKKVIRL